MTQQTTERPRVLAIDDNEDILELIRITLEADYDVVTLCDPVDVLEILDLFEPDLLILDIMMPRINGYQILEMLRRAPNTKDLPVIVLSARTTAGEIKHGYKLGATMYLTKPFQPDRLRKNVETQFRVNPPTERTKATDGHRLSLQLESTSSFRRRHLQMSSGLQRDRNLLDARRLIEDRIRRDGEGEPSVSKIEG